MSRAKIAQDLGYLGYDTGTGEFECLVSEIRAQEIVDYIRKVGEEDSDDEAAHALEDALYRWVLRGLLRGEVIGNLPRIVLRTREFEFCRRCG